MDGFTLHAATRAGALDNARREALLRYVLRPPIAQGRIEPQSNGLVRIALKRAYADGTFPTPGKPPGRLLVLPTRPRSQPPGLTFASYVGSPSPVVAASPSVTPSSSLVPLSEPIPPSRGVPPSPPPPPSGGRLSQRSLVRNHASACSCRDSNETGRESATHEASGASGLRRKSSRTW